MTDEQINEAIAEAIGGKRECDIGTLYSSPDGWTPNCPDFCGDLNAMHEAEKELPKELQQEFVLLLHDVCGKQFWGHFNVVTATARQRAEAFIRALSKREEVQR